MIVMKDLLKMAEYLQNYGQALENGVNKFMDSLPLYTRQHIRGEARKRLNTTRDHYMSKVSVKLDGYILIVELDRNDWLANAVESGVGQFNMKDGHLNSPKAKTSKKGYRYMSIPLGVSKDKNPADNDSSKEFQKKINEVLSKPKFGIKKLSVLMNGMVQETQKVLTTDSQMQGLYRTRLHNTDDLGAVMMGESKPKWNFVLFRTMSENPDAKGQWVHPGIRPVHIFKKTENWLEQNVEELLNGFIETEVASLNMKTFSGGGE